MEFWGSEIKPGKPIKVTPEEDNLIHISQAALGETKKIQKGETVHLFAKVGEQKFVLGTLSHDNFPQINFDLVFEKEFELSHNWKNGSVHVIGYKSPNIDEEDEGFSDSDASDEEELPVTAAENGICCPSRDCKAKAVEIAKPAKEAAVKQKAAFSMKNVESDSEEDDSDDDDEDDESDSEEGMDVDEGSDEDSEDEDEETPKKVEQSKKRANDSASKTPVPAKKAKAATPQKTDGKKGGHTATPYPAKKGGKTSPFASQSPKSGKNKNRGGK